MKSVSLNVLEIERIWRQLPGMHARSTRLSPPPQFLGERGKKTLETSVSKDVNRKVSIWLLLSLFVCPPL